MLKRIVSENEETRTDLKWKLELSLQYRRSFERGWEDWGINSIYKEDDNNSVTQNLIDEKKVRGIN